ncbi:MAG: DUF5916 domain-containing protein [Planctomycetota bacterium]
MTAITGLLVAAWSALPLGARQDPGPRATAHVGRVAEADAPRVDGHLEDPCWATAPAIGDFVTVYPWEGGAPSKRTVVRLLHDRHNLYIACWCFDDRPQDIRASVRARDADLLPDDLIEILLDPFANRRTAYQFQIGAGGAIGDMLISGNGEKFDREWDAVWTGVASVTADGWMAEIAIPFRSLPRRQGASAWGFDVLRAVRANSEEYHWAHTSQAVPFYRVSGCGTIDCFGEIDAGVGIEVVPYATAGFARDRAASDDAFDRDLDAGGEIYYRLTPGMTLATTFFTDFAETENDERQINLTRFPLFFREKRDFFLDGVGYFAFGADGAGGVTLLPFFTRRIGLHPDGSKIPLLAGVKLTGEMGPFEVGLLDVQTDDAGTLDGRNLAVARVNHAVTEQTTVGLIATGGNATDDAGNAVAGVDWHHHFPEFVGDLDLRIAVDALASAGAGASGESYGLDLRSSGSEWSFGASSRWVSPDFVPALGFVSHPDSRSFDLQAAYQPLLDEGSAIRNLHFGVGALRRERWSGGPQEAVLAIDHLGVVLPNFDLAYAFLLRTFDRVDSDFTVFRGTTTVFAGDYHATRGGIAMETSAERPWDILLRAETGGFFGGSSDQIAVEARWRVTPLLHLGGGYDSARVDLGPGRAFTTHIASARVDLHVSPELSLLNLVQFDNESNELGWQSRLRWTYAPGCDFFAVVGSTWVREDDGALVPTEQALQFKVSHSLRF